MLAHMRDNRKSRESLQALSWNGDNQERPRVNSPPLSGPLVLPSDLAEWVPFRYCYFKNVFTCSVCWLSIVYVFLYYMRRILNCVRRLLTGGFSCGPGSAAWARLAMAWALAQCRGSFLQHVVSSISGLETVSPATRWQLDFITELGKKAASV